MTFGYFSSQKSNAPPAGVQIKSFVKLAPPLGDCKPGHVHLPEGKWLLCYSTGQERGMTMFS